MRTDTINHAMGCGHEMGLPLGLPQHATLRRKEARKLLNTVERRCNACLVADGRVTVQEVDQWWAQWGIEPRG